MKHFALLFSLGFVGILTLYSLPLPTGVNLQHHEKWVLLLNPTILLMLATGVGVFSYQKSNLNVALLSNRYNSIFRRGLLEGAFAGILMGTGMVVLRFWFRNLLPDDFMAYSSDKDYYLLHKLLYGGITEELLIRFGMLTPLLAISNTFLPTYPTVGRLAANTLSALFFAWSHLPLLFATYAPVSTPFVTFSMGVNFVSGLLFGYLYIRNSLESSMVAHLVTHIVIALLLLITHPF